MSTARSMRSRASVQNFTSLAAISIAPEESSSCGASEANLEGMTGIERVGGSSSGSRPAVGSLGRGVSGDHAHDVGLLHDQKVLALDLHLGAGPLAEQHPVARLQVDRNELAGLVATARTDRNDLAFLRLLLDGIRNDDPALGLLFRFDAADDYAVMQGTELELGHVFPLWVRNARMSGTGAPRANSGSGKGVSTQLWRVPAAGREIWGCT